MKKMLLSFLGLFTVTVTAFAQRATVPVFVSGQDGYRSYRIPAIIRLPDDDILAFAEGRVNGSADFGDVDIVMKRSTDGGRSWSALQVVATNDSLQAGNAAPVVDLTDPAFPHGRIFLFYNTGDRSESDIRRGIGKRKVWYETSADDGRTWSPPADITNQVKRKDWRSYANTPGHATQIAEGRYQGRLYVAANHSQGSPQRDFGDYRAHGFYTDDHGKSFHLSDEVPFPGGNEAMAVTCGLNRLMMNIRNQKGEPRCRIVAVSPDGGATWDTTYYDRQLPDPVCQGSILRVGGGRHGAVLAFCNNADTLARDSLTVRISTDGGKHWEKKYLVDGNKAGSAYSDLVRTTRRRLGIIYERDDYRQIVFTTLKWRK
jgi:sialidase-1